MPSAFAQAPKSSAPVQVDNQTLQQIQRGLAELDGLREENALLREQVEIRGKLVDGLKVQVGLLERALTLSQEANKRNEEALIELRKANEKLEAKARRSSKIAKVLGAVGFVVGAWLGAR